MGSPLIGVTTSEVRTGEQTALTPQGEPARNEMALGLKYLEAIESAGGIPVVLPPLADAAIEPLVSQLAGICLSGGPDLDPATYGQEPHPQLGPLAPHVDRFELQLARLAWSFGMPILAICRGAQTLNVSRGGTLFQHLPDLPSVTINHRQTEPADESTHAVEIAKGSRLAELIGSEQTEVNSFHHQATDRLGDDLRVVARSPDGVVEGIETTGRGFAVGVQWHAECLTGRPDNRRLFEGLVSAANLHIGSRVGIRAA